MLSNDVDRLRSIMTEAARRLTASRSDASDSELMLAAIVAGVLVALPAAAAASITLIDKHGALSTHASSDDVVSAVDRMQAELGEGPCVDALSEHGDDVTDAPDLTVDPPWPRFASAALQAGFGAVLSFQLRTDRTAGAVNLYGASAHCFSSDDHLVGALFADQAAVALSGARRAGELNRALESRDVIGRAKGVLMERFRVNDSEAFAMLVEASQHANLKLNGVAAWFVAEAEQLYANERSARKVEVG